MIAIPFFFAFIALLVFAIVWRVRKSELLAAKQAEQDARIASLERQVSELRVGKSFYLQDPPVIR